MARSARESAPRIFWPLAALWDLLAFLLGLTGRIVGVIVALVLLMLGLLLTFTVILVPLGIPLMIVGFLLLLRSLF